MSHITETQKKLFLMQQVYATLFSLSNKLQAKGDEHLGGGRSRHLEGLTTRQLMMMISIMHLPEGEASLNNIARMLGTSKQNVKQLVSILEKHGYVVVLPSRLDRRSSNVRITEAGKQITLKCGTMGNAFLEKISESFTEEELETLWSLLRKLYRFDGEEQADFEEEATFR
ncbi:MAG TPA: MarR family transcriptional regulator [Methanocella sp.]|nr:MarR family transcriptional regulator [Methanocella sp.]